MLVLFVLLLAACVLLLPFWLLPLLVRCLSAAASKMTDKKRRDGYLSHV